MLYVQGAVWGRGLVAFLWQKSTKTPPPRLSKNENKSD